MLARSTIFFPLLLGWVQFLSFLILMILRRLAQIQFKPELPFSSEFLEKFSARVQIRTHALPFFFICFYYILLFLYFIARKNRIQSRLQ